MLDRAIILIVDDVAANRETLCALLEGENFQLLEAADGPAALRLAADTPPDLVLLDVMMPGMDGYAVCRLLRADPKLAEVPVIMVTALDDQASRLAGLEAGADDFITKPFNRAELRARVRTITRLNRYRRLHAAQAALIDSEKHFHALFELGPVAIYSCDAAGTIQSFNQRAATLWGRSPVLGEGGEKFGGSFRLYQPDGTAVARDQSPMAQVCRGEVPVIKDREFIVERPDGSRIAVIVNIVALLDDAGKISCAIGSFTDITERKKSEESVRLLSSVVEQSAESIMITDNQLDLPGPRILFVNPAFTRMTGYTAAEVLGQTPRILQGSRTDTAVLERLRQTLERDETFEGSVINYRKDGTEFDLEWQVAPIRDDQGRTTHFTAIQRDVTQRNAVNRALREGEQWLRAVFEQGAVGVVQTDVTTGRFVRFNRRFCDIVGYTPAELGQLTFTDITDPKDLVTNAENVTRLRAGAVREFAQEKRYVRKDGSSVWTSIAVSAIGPADAVPVSFVAFVQDISERKRLDEHFLQAQKMEALGQFSGGVAHDFNNILAAIGGYTELSRMLLKENPEVHEHLGAVLQAARRAADLVRQILTFSQQQPQKRQPIQLQPIVTESLKLMRATIPATVEFEVSVDAEAPTVLANAGQVHQILMNLGINASHAMQNGSGLLRVTLEKFLATPEFAATQPRLRPGDYVRLSVADTGCGMDAATIRRIYEPFFTTKRPGEGTGLGLSVVHGIMESHDGAITVQSQPGEGTVFRLYFPLHAGAAILPPSGTHAPFRGGGERILVVDDEELLAQLLQKALTVLGYEVDFVTVPAAAVDLVRADPDRFALVLTDQTMPGLTGLELAREIHAIRAGMPIILMTGYSLSLTEDRVAAAGIRQLLLKPASIHTLSNAIHSALTKPKRTPTPWPESS